MKWKSRTSLVLSVEGSTQVLSVLVEFESLVVFALAVPMRSVTSTDDVDRLQQVMGHHEHKIIGQAKTLREGVQMGEDYAEEWLRADAEFQACACEEIGDK